MFCHLQRSLCSTNDACILLHMQPKDFGVWKNKRSQSQRCVSQVILHRSQRETFNTGCPPVWLQSRTRWFIWYLTRVITWRLHICNICRLSPPDAPHFSGAIMSSEGPDSSMSDMWTDFDCLATKTFFNWATCFNWTELNLYTRAVPFKWVKYK